MNAPFTLHDLHDALRVDFPSFVRKVFEILNPGREFKDNWHLKALVHQIEEVMAGRVTRLAVTLPPRSLKSMIVSIALPAFILGRDPTQRIVCVSATQALSEAHARDFRRVVESDLYGALFPATQAAKNTESEFTTTMGGHRLATSIGGTLTGRGGDLIIVDDPLNAQDAVSDAERDKANEFYRSTLLSRLDDKSKGAIIIVMQRLHVDDLVGFVLRNSGDYTHLNLPAIAMEDQVIQIGSGRLHYRKVGDVLHPERESLEVLERLKRDKGTAAFQAQYQQQPVPPEGNLVKLEWLQRYGTWPTQRQQGDKVVQSWDTASKGGEHHDYSVCTTWYVRGEKRLLVDVVRQHCDYPTLQRLVVEQYRHFRPDALLIEDHGSGTALIQDLRTNQQISAIPILPEGDKITRLSIVSPQFEAGQVLLPSEAPWLAELLHELLRFPHVRFDDQVDSITQFLLWQRSRSNRTTFHADFGFPTDAIPNPDVLLHARYRL